LAAREEEGLADEETEAEYEVIAALQESIAEVKAGGRLLTLEEMEAEFEAFRAQRLAEKAARVGH
jgi:hypothetical protein